MKAEIYAKRYSVGLQDVLYSPKYMPNGETMDWIIELVSWLNYYDNVRETCEYLDTTCPEYIQDDPDQFNLWVKSQKRKAKNNG